MKDLKKLDILSCCFAGITTENDEILSSDLNSKLRLKYLTDRLIRNKRELDRVNKHIDDLNKYIKDITRKIQKDELEINDIKQISHEL